MNNVNRKDFLKLIGLGGAALLLPSTVSAKKKEATEPLDPNPQPLRVAHLTDIHVQPNRAAEFGFAECLTAVNNLPDKVDFIINGGDSIMNAASVHPSVINNQWKSFHNIVNQNNTLEINHCIGNHDIFGWELPSNNHTATKQRAMDEYKMTERYYSIVKGKWKFIILDSIHGRNTIPGYFGKLDEAQMTWLKNEFKTTDASTYICIVTHIPILAVCTMFDGKHHYQNHWRTPDSSIHADAEELITLFYQYPNIKSCLSGHIHLIDYVHYLGVDYYCNGAVSGAWWNGSYHQFAPSFSVMKFYDNGKTEREINYYNWSEIV